MTPSVYLGYFLTDTRDDNVQSGAHGLLIDQRGKFGNACFQLPYAGLLGCIGGRSGGAFQPQTDTPDDARPPGVQIAKLIRRGIRALDALELRSLGPNLGVNIGEIDA